MSKYKTLETISINEQLNNVPDKIINVIDFDHRQSIIATKKPTIVYYSTNWCEPCKKFAPDFSLYSIKYPNINFLKEDAQHFFDTPEPITGVPCVHFYKNGTYLHDMTIVGIDNKLFEERLNIIQL